jgi:hypothetical protein
MKISVNEVDLKCCGKLNIQSACLYLATLAVYMGSAASRPMKAMRIYVIDICHR